MQETHKLIIDIGNSRVKFYFLDKTYFSLEELFLVFDFHKSFSLNLSIFIISTDKSKTKSIIEAMQEKFAKQIISIDVFEPFRQREITNLYQGLGADRIAKLLGLKKLFPDSNIALFDFGTALTSSLLSAKGEFLGGFINLGFRASLESLADLCAELDDYSKEVGLEILLKQSEYGEIAQSSKAAIISGAYFQFKYLIEGYINSFDSKLNTKFLKVCTGGDAKFFADLFDHHLDSKKILESAFSHIVPN